VRAVSRRALVRTNQSACIVLKRHAQMIGALLEVAPRA
jgi:hypothetical protein